LLNQILPHTGDVVQWGAMMLGGVLIVVALLIKRKKKEN
jgi:LPXTG-motif cell wall-anchored protein